MKIPPSPNGSTNMQVNTQETESHFRDLVDASPAMIWMTDVNSSCVYLSKQWYAFTGRTPEQDLGLGWLENIHPDDLAETSRVYANAVMNRGELRVDYRLRNSSGNYRWAIDLGYPRFNSAGEFIGYIGTVTDIHDRIALENELKILLRRFERSSAATDLGIWYCDLPFADLIWNAQVKNHFWLPPEAHVTIDTFYERIHPDDREPTRLAIEASTAKNRPYDIVYRTTKPSDPSQIKYIRAMGWTDFDQHGNPKRFDGLTLDISGERKVQEELQKEKVNAETANKAKSAFLANMSHEIRTPLGAILGFTELLRDSNLTLADRDHYIDTVSRNGKALTRIIDDILDLAKVESGKMELETVEFSFYDLLQEATDLFRERAKEKGLYLLLNIADSVPDRLCSDPTRLRQIILNLVGNAIKFTEKGGVKVRVRSLDSSRDSHEIEISVEDTGVGIAPEKRDRLFQPFVQADSSTARRYGGTGLGLVVSGRLAKALGGEIRIVDCAVGSGCNFVLNFEAQTQTQTRSGIVLLPQASSSNQPIASGPAAATLPLADLRLVVADDSPDNRTLVSRMLTKAGATVITAIHGRDAVEHVLKEKPDLVLMDIQMPEMDGYEATRELRRLDVKIPIIALTAHAMSEDYAKSMAAGCNSHLTKPLDRLELIKTIQRLARP